MKKILFPILLIALLFSACGGNVKAEEPVVDAAATAIAEVLYATQAALASEKEAEVVEITEAVKAVLNTEYTDAAPVYTQLMAGVLMLKDTGMAVSADQASTLLSLLSSLADVNPENPLTEDVINEGINQAVAVLSTEQIQAISAMQITQESAMSVLQDIGLELNEQTREGSMGGPGMGGAEGGEPPAGDPGNPGNPGEGGPGGAGAPSDDQEMDRGMMIQPQLIQALMLYLQSVSA